jgi:hypothetical protein
LLTWKYIFNKKNILKYCALNSNTINSCDFIIILCGVFNLMCFIFTMWRRCNIDFETAMMIKIREPVTSSVKKSNLDSLRFFLSSFSKFMSWIFEFCVHNEVGSCLRVGWLKENKNCRFYLLHKLVTFHFVC